MYDYFTVESHSELIFLAVSLKKSDSKLHAL